MIIYFLVFKVKSNEEFEVEKFSIFSFHISELLGFLVNEESSASVVSSYAPYKLQGWDQLLCHN